MQIFFSRGPQAPVRHFALNIRNLLILLGATILILMVLNALAGWLLGALGFERASDTSTRSMEARYEQKLSELGAQISELNVRIKRLDAARQQMIQETPLPPAPATQPQPAAVPVKPVGGQGGPLLLATSSLPASSSLTVRVDQLDVSLRDLQGQTRVLAEQLYALKNWKAAAPTGYPLPYEVPVSSLPGLRADPFTGVSSWHAGTDYAAYAGMPIMATGDGYVVRAAWDNDFGHVVEVMHPGVNALTRYAHAEAIYVKPGQRVKRGEVIARVGSTGRSTAPHLHYEVQSIR
jgi:murein DD-endopeptidase MepM/ murein hydrolase activator NlpD